MHRSRRTAARAALLALGATAAGVLTLATPAAAHVTVNPDEATKGGYARLAFRVPTESDTASTTKLEVTLPADAPITSVSTMPVPGWNAVIERRKLDKPLDSHGTQITEVASKITWTAGPGAAIKPGQFQEFPVSLGPLPDNVDRLVFKALQTYSDSAVVHWIEEPPAAGGAEPENPAPVLTLAAKPASSPVVAAPNASTTAENADSDSGSGSAGVWLGAIALLAALAALTLATLAFTRRRPTT